MMGFNTRKRRGFSIVEFVVVVAIAMTAVATSFPALMQAREAARRSACKNNLKMLGVALHNYHDVHGMFAPGWTNDSWDATDIPRFGWGASILPMLDEGHVFSKLNFRAPMPPPTAMPRADLEVLRCPSDVPPNPNPLRGGYGVSNYAGNFGSDPFPRWRAGRLSRGWPGRLATPRESNRTTSQLSGLFRCNSSLRFRDITDGTSNTLMAGERAYFTGAAIWPGVGGNRFEDDVLANCSQQINSTWGAFSSMHEGGAQFVLADGSAVFLSQGINSNLSLKANEMGTFQRLGARADGEVLGEF